MSEDFLSRWSRRKRDARRSDTAAPTEPPTQEPSAQGNAAPSESRPADELSPEEVAALPPVEGLTAESDIAAFLRRGVPQALRNAALRRVWALDPEIRDYVGHARDYAYDWNVAGGVPGTGPLEAGTDVGRMVEDIFGRPDLTAAEDTGGAGEPQQPNAAVASRDPPSEFPRASGGEAAETAPDAHSPVQTPSTCREGRTNLGKIRHGGAKPT